MNAGYMLLVVVCTCVATAFALAWRRERQRARESLDVALLSAYACELRDRRLLCTFDLVDGRCVSFQLDGPFVYELSGVFLAAASRLGAERPGTQTVDPATRKPNHLGATS